MLASLGAAAEELSARRAPKKPATDLLSDTFPQQRAFCEDAAPFVTAVCGRRAGKTEGAARFMLRAEQQKPQAPVLYFTTTRNSARRIMWGTLLDLNARHGLGLEPHESTLTLRRAGRDRIYLTGCDNQTEIGKMRGSGWGAVVGDEAQNFPAYLRPLVEENLTPALMDYQGTIRLCGTPAPVPSGYFFECAKSPEWSHHAWQSFANPHVDARTLVKQVCRLRGITDAHPSIRREFYGEWSYDASALVVAWNPAINTWHMLPQLTDYVVGVDLGFDDADAIAVLGWQKGLPGLYLVEEHVLAKQSITQLTDRLRTVYDTYQPLAVVVDTGGLGKKITDEVQRRSGLPLQAAEKTEKLMHIELLNDALRTGRFFAHGTSRFGSDALLVEWDRTNPEKPKISDRYHSDIIDSVLYAYRRALHWLHEPAQDGPKAGTPEACKAAEDEMERAAEEQHQERQERTQEYGSYT